MCPTNNTDASPDVSRVQAVLELLEGRLRTISAYGPEDSVHEQEVERIREGFSGLWLRLSGLPLTVTEDGLQWEADDVLPIDDEKEGLAWALFEAGVRFLAFSPGVEKEEVSTFLAAIHRSRSFTEDDVDDLLTLLWTADFQYIRHKAPEVVPESQTTAEGERPAAAITAGGTPAGGTPAATLPKAEDVRRRVEEDVRDVGPGAPTPGIVDLAQYESTLYFLDTAEIRYLQEEVECEYAQDLGRNVLSLLFDTFELQTDSEVRAEIIAILTDMLPQLLIGGDFRSVAYLISEARLVLRRAPEISADHQGQLSELTRALSAPGAVTQLMHALDEARVEPSEKDLEGLLRQLSPGAFTTTLKWLHRLSNEGTRRLLNQAIGEWVESRPDVIKTALDSGERVVIVEALRIVEERGLTGLNGELAALAKHDDVRVRAAIVPALIRTPTASTMAALVPLLRDPDPDIRIAAVQGLSTHAYLGALQAVEEVILDRNAESDLTERRAFFEAYGSIAGEAAVPTLKTLIMGGGLGRGRGDSDTRACATLALGRVGTRSARLILQKVAKDRDVVVRTAAARALQTGGA